MPAALLIRVRYEAHIASEIISGKYFIFSKYRQHETLGFGMRAVPTNTLWQPVINFVCQDCWCANPKQTNPHCFCLENLTDPESVLWDPCCALWWISNSSVLEVFTLVWARLLSISSESTVCKRIWGGLGWVLEKKRLSSPGTGCPGRWWTHHIPGDIQKTQRCGA